MPFLNRQEMALIFVAAGSSPSPIRSGGRGGEQVSRHRGRHRRRTRALFDQLCLHRRHWAWRGSPSSRRRRILAGQGEPRPLGDQPDPSLGRPLGGRSDSDPDRLSRPSSPSGVALRPTRRAAAPARSQRRRLRIRQSVEGADRPPSPTACSPGSPRAPGDPDQHYASRSFTVIAKAPKGSTCPEKIMREYPTPVVNQPNLPLTGSGAFWETSAYRPSSLNTAVRLLAARTGSRSSW